MAADTEGRKEKKEEKKERKREKENHVLEKRNKPRVG